MYAQLGNIRFEGLKGFSSLEETYAVNYAQHERIKSKPRLERVGDILDTISFEMYLHAQFTDPEADIESMRVAMQSGEILTLILGNGKIVGDFVIPNFTKTTEFTDPSGNLISVNLAVELLECFNENRLEEARKQAKNNAFATNERNSNIRSTLVPKLSPATEVTANISKMETSAILATQHVDAVNSNLSTADYYSGKINDTMDSIEGNITAVQTALNNNAALLNGAVTLPASLNGVYTAVQNIKAVLPITDANGARFLVNQLKSAVLQAQTANVVNTNMSIIRRN